ncbi:MAG: sigma 54-interacting transcriptional regulator [Sulfurifustis sp.]
MNTKDAIADISLDATPDPVLVADSDPAFILSVCADLSRRGWTTAAAQSADAALTVLANRRPPLVVLGEFGDPAGDVRRITERIRALPYECPVIFVPRASSEDLAITALRAGITDYVRRSACSEELLGCIERRLPAPGESTRAAPADLRMERFIGASQATRSMKQFLLKVAQTSSNVLITGETGTGKELVTELLHEMSARRDRPLICINCAALPDNLLESELFGYERGAFTGAHKAYPGRLQLAAGGTVMLDEIGEMTPYAQAKLLRAIESREVLPLGARRAVPVNVRIVAATNREPESLMRDSRFRSDLYFRLNVARIHLAPLRERKEDVVPLFQHHVAEFSRRLGTSARNVSHDAWQCLLHYDWPGNVRELRNVVEAIFIDPPAGDIGIDDLPEYLRRRAASAPSAESERERVLAVLTATRWNKSDAAKQLQWSRMTLYRKMTKYNLLQSRRPPPLTKTRRREG